jgi:hypothetical protein
MATYYPTQPVATTSTPGAMSAADKTKLDYEPIQLEDVALTAQTSHATPAWTADAYSKIEIELFGTVSGGTPANSNMTLVVNADSGNNYQHQAIVVTTAVSAQTSVYGTLGYAAVGSYNNSNSSGYAARVVFFPKTTGAARMGMSESSSMWPGTASLGGGSSFKGGFMWKDTATNVTSLTIGFLDGASFTGRFRVYGWP